MHSFTLKSFSIKLFAILFSLLSISILTWAEDFPERSTTIVTDYTNTLSQGQMQTLEQKLVAFNDSTSSQVAIVMLGSVGGYDISDYAVQLYNRWGIGQKAKNNGVLILVAKDDRKVFITTGYGMEGVLPDALCKRIVDRDIVPNFKLGNYYEGLDAAVNSIIGLVKGEYTADQYMQHQKKEKVPWFGVLLAMFILFIVVISKIGSTRNYARRNNLGFWAAWALMNAAMNRGRSRGSWGGFSGGSGGFGGGGGGFGGFGGGSSGGGGAGGSW